MVYLIYGGSGSGKSAFAEKCISELSEDEGGCENKIYIATMKVYDEEDEKRVKRHRSMRQGAGFETLEILKNIHMADEGIISGKNVLLECVSNLVANEMFKEDNVVCEQVVVENVMKGIKRIENCAGNFVIVSNNIFEDGLRYDDTTMAYMRALSAINSMIAKMADKVYEVVVGIPVCVK